MDFSAICKKGDVIAFKTTKPGFEGMWFTGQVSYCTDSQIWVDIYLPVYPQWESDGDFTKAYAEDIEKIVNLEPAE